MELNDFTCSRCHAGKDQPCTTPKGDLANEPHKARVDAYWAAFTPGVDRTYESVLVELEFAVREHALANYTTGGWDVLVETCDGVQLMEIIRGARSVGGAISKAARHFGVIDSVRADIVSA